MSTDATGATDATAAPLGGGFATFEDFWPHYLSEHGDPTNRALHLAGTSLALGCVAVAALRRSPGWALAAPVVGYGLAWLGHFAHEGNRPATFSHPAWSLRGDMRMLHLAATGGLERELERLGLRD